MAEEPDKLAELMAKAAELASQAKAATAPLRERAGELAAQAAAAAAPLVAQARERAGGLAEQAAPLLEKAGQAAAHGVGAAAESLDRATGGKYAQKISSISTMVEHQLDRSGRGHAAEQQTGQKTDSAGGKPTDTTDADDAEETDD